MKAEQSFKSSMDVVPRFSHRLLLPLSPTTNFFPKAASLQTHHSHKTLLRHYRHFRKPSSSTRQPDPIIRPVPFLGFVGSRSSDYGHSSRDLSARAGWLMGAREKKPKLPEIVKAGDPVLHEPAREVSPEEIGSDRIQKLIDDMVRVMRVAPGVGLAAPQIGVPLQIIVLEDTQEYINFQPKEETDAQQRRPFDLVVMINPKLKPKTKKTALFFEGCLSVDGYRAVVERFLEVEVTGLDRYGEPVKVNASGWQARIFQHECDHLAGTIYVDKMAKRTFRITENLDLPLPIGCPKLGPK